MMAETAELIEALDARVRRREERRDFFSRAMGMAALAGGTALAWTSKAGAQAAPSEPDILNFALNLEYLEAQFYSFAANGTGLPAAQLTGTGTQGAVTGGRQVAFTDPVVRQYAREIAADEAAHVAFLRQQLGMAAVAQPALNISGDANGAFTAAARAAEVVPATGTFDPYASDEFFLLGAYIFEDVGVTAYKGAAPLLTNKTFLQAAAGILAVEAYHAAIIRTSLYVKGITVPPSGVDLRRATDQISTARDTLDGTTGANNGDLDQGVSPTGSGATTTSNIVPVDGDAIAFSRTPGQVLNIVYLNRAAVTAGGFFPAGVNGAIRTSAAN